MRSRDWNEGPSECLKDLSYARILLSPLWKREIPYRRL